MSQRVFLDLCLPKNKKRLKEWVISSYAKALCFPDYWQPNWDSFEEILLEKLNEKSLSLTVRHIEWTTKNYEELKPYEAIVKEVAEFYENFVLEEAV